MLQQWVRHLEQAVLVEKQRGAHVLARFFLALVHVVPSVVLVRYLGRKGRVLSSDCHLGGTMVGVKEVDRQMPSVPSWDIGEDQ